MRRIVSGYGSVMLKVQLRRDVTTPPELYMLMRYVCFHRRKAYGEEQRSWKKHMVVRTPGTTCSKRPLNHVPTRRFFGLCMPKENGNLGTCLEREKSWKEPLPRIPTMKTFGLRLLKLKRRTGRQRQQELCCSGQETRLARRGYGRKVSCWNASLAIMLVHWIS